MKIVKAESPVSKTENSQGFTKEEQKVHDKLMECYQAFLDLKTQHPEDRREFAYAVHLIQGLLSLRVVRRSYPEGWSTYGP